MHLQCLTNELYRHFVGHQTSFQILSICLISMKDEPSVPEVVSQGSKHRVASIQRRLLLPLVYNQARPEIGID